MITANYYKEKQTLTLVGSDNLPMSGFIGTIAEQKAKQLSENGIPVFTVETKLYPSAEKIAEEILNHLSDYWYDIDDYDDFCNMYIEYEPDWGYVTFNTEYHYYFTGDGYNTPREAMIYCQTIYDLKIIFADETECDYTEEIEEIVNNELEKSF